MTAKTVAALCAGVGGLEMGLSQFGFEPAWYCETDDDAATVMEKRHAGVPNLGDIRDRATWRTAPAVDLLAAGVPCQPVSAAGRQLGRDDPRYLWPAAKDAIAALMPPTVLLENVQNLVSINKGSILTEILADLAALRYAVRWTVLGACAVGLSHHRHRWFLRAERVDSGQVPSAVRIRTKCGADSRRYKLLPTPCARDGDEDQRGEGSPDFWERRRKIRPTQGIPLGAELGLLAAAGERWGRFDWAIQRQVATTGVLPPEPTEPNTRGGRRMAAPFPEWMMAYPAGWVTDLLDRPAALRCIGNGASPIQVAAAWHLTKHPSEDFR